MAEDEIKTKEHTEEGTPTQDPEQHELLEAAEYALDRIEKFEGDYPLREPEEDPRWAVRTVRTWVGLGLFFLGFIITLIILGVFYE